MMYNHVHEYTHRVRQLLFSIYPRFIPLAFVDVWPVLTRLALHMSAGFVRDRE